MRFKDELESETDQNKVKEAWLSFVQGRELPKGGVPDYIVKGWIKSRSFGVDPEAPIVPPVLSEADLDLMRQENSLLLESAEPILKMLEVSIRGTGHIATLAVASGHLLAVVGDDKLMEQAKLQYNIPGAERSIEQVGSSALSLSIEERRPVMILGYEHYSKPFHDWRCAAAPIFSIEDTPIASLTISSHISKPEMHSLALAHSCAECISIRMREKALMDSRERLNALVQTVHNGLPDSVIALNSQGTITHANNKAFNFLDPTLDLIGKSYLDIFGVPDQPRVKNILLKEKQQTMELEVLSSNGPKNLICRFIPLALESGLKGGMTVAISSEGQVMDIVKRVGGNYAKYSFDDIKGESLALKEQINLAMKAAESSQRILITGDSGTGKELFAQSIHNYSSTSNGPFVAISCAAIPRDLIESELFGYVGGAFTGARRNGMVGKMELATGGTLFLDEINSLPLEVQAKLLRVLQQMEIYRLGDTKPTSINARIIAATNQDLRECVQQGTFREDLFFRLNVVEIKVPALKNRKDDISLLAHTFLRRLSYEINRPFKYLRAETLDSLYNYKWPGNVRELENICERALLLSETGIIYNKHLPPHIGKISSAEVEKEVEEIKLQSGGRVDDLYQQLLMDTLAKNNGNISQSARDLGVARSTLYRRMKQFGMEY